MRWPRQRLRPLAFRDPHGIRPLIYGKREYKGGTEWVVASESVAITALGFEVVADVQPGEAIFISSSGHLFSKQCAEKSIHTMHFRACLLRSSRFHHRWNICLSSSTELRVEGSLNAALEDWPDHDIDAVIPVPDSDEFLPFKWQTHSTFLTVKDLSRIAMLVVPSLCLDKRCE